MGQLDRRSRPVEKAVLASDLHLHEGDPAGVVRACRFLTWVRRQEADALFLLGDVFKAWLGARSLRTPGLAPFLDGLAACVGEGMRVVLLHGNHDFMTGSHLERAVGVEVAGTRLDVALGGQRACLCHGDAFCTRDVSFQRLHRVLRSRVFRWTVSHLPPAALRAVAAGLVTTANRTTRQKSREVMSIVDDEVRRTLAQDVDVVVCGHVHEARDARFSGGGRLVVMADFETRGSHAVWRDGALKLVRHDLRFTLDEGLVVAIDGPAGSGKTSVSRALADRFGFAWLDSGALYRAVTARLLREGLGHRADAFGPVAQSIRWKLDEAGTVWMDGERLSRPELRGTEVSALVSRVSADGAVRAALLGIQRGVAARSAGLVAEGRDMGSVVFPGALFRFFLDARPEVRARRRLAQEPGEGSTLEEVSSALDKRDRQDASRVHAPLAVPDGAVRVDTSELTQEEVVDRLAEIVREGLGRDPSGGRAECL